MAQLASVRSAYSAGTRSFVKVAAAVERHDLDGHLRKILRTLGIEA